MNFVLIADSDSAARKALTLLLKHRFGVEEVREAGDVESLIRAMAECQPDLLFLDWRLYSAPAPETWGLLRKAYPMLKIVMLSANANDVTAAYDAKAGFIHKGAAADQLIATLKPLFQE